MITNVTNSVTRPNLVKLEPLCLDSLQTVLHRFFVVSCPASSRRSNQEVEKQDPRLHLELQP